MRNNRPRSLGRPLAAAFLGASAALCIGAIAPDGNLLKHPGFENAANPLEGWTTFGTPWRGGVGDDAFAGRFGAVNDVLPGSKVGYCGIFQEVPINAAKTYDASAMLRTVNLSSSESFLEIQFLDRAGAVVGAKQSPSAVGDQPFTSIEMKGLKPPSDAVKASVRGIVHIRSSPERSNFHIFDDFRFAESRGGAH